VQNKAAVGMHKTVISPDQDETSHIYKKKGKGKTENGFASLSHVPPLFRFGYLGFIPGQEYKRPMINTIINRNLFQVRN